VPIAGAALLGQKFGKQKLWIIGAFIVQSLIFGAGHANYPMQPFYARLVELIIPSIAFGLLYLYFGLLPAIILHFAYDVVWFALPLFVASSPNIWIQQLLVILLTLIPLWIVLWARLKKKALADQVPDALTNNAFQPPAPKVIVDDTPTSATQVMVKKSANIVFAVVGILSLLLWFGFTSFENGAPTLELSRAGAEKIADQELAGRQIELGPEWKKLSRVEAPLNLDDRFIWQEEGDSTYAELMDKYLGTPYWRVRYATFEGDVADRAEEYFVNVKRADKWEFSHILPEKAPGDSLDEQSARAIAEDELINKYDANPNELKFISATPSKLDNRTDWTFVWADTANHPLKSGECRLVVNLAGSEVTNSVRTIHVPDEWSRAEREKNNLINIIDIIMGAGPFLILAVAFVFSIISWSRKKFDVRLFLKIAVLLTVVVLINILNSWPNVTSMFVTAAPWMHQALITIIFSVLGAIIVGMSLGMVNGYIKAVRTSVDNRKMSPLAALGAGLLIAAVGTVVQSFAPSLSPIWADYSAMGSQWPVLTLALNSITGLFIMGTAYMLIFNAADRFTQFYSRRQLVTIFLFILTGFILTDVRAAGSIPFWLMGGALKGLLLWMAYFFVLRYRLSLAPMLYLPMLLLRNVKGYVHDAYPGAQIGYILGFMILIVVAIVWERWMRTE
jgi:hypothetical protein